jgi:hypothetical protein
MLNKRFVFVSPHGETYDSQSGEETSLFTRCDKVVPDLGATNLLLLILLLILLFLLPVSEFFQTF